VIFKFFRVFFILLDCDFAGTGALYGSEGQFHILSVPAISFSVWPIIWIGGQDTKNGYILLCPPNVYSAFHRILNCIRCGENIKKEILVPLARF
jgi:hypothetical protein